MGCPVGGPLVYYFSLTPLCMAIGVTTRFACSRRSISDWWEYLFVPQGNKHQEDSLSESVEPPRHTKFPCPCCGFLTLEHPADGRYDVCPVCFWEDDVVQNEDPLYAGGANEPSLVDAREAFRRVGAVEERLAQHTRAPLSTEIPTASSFELALSAEDVSQVRFDHAVTLVFGGGATVRFETGFSLREAAGARVRVPSDAIEEPDRSLFVPVMQLLGQIVSAATAFPSGELTITFDNGAAIACPPHPDFEAWEYVGPDGRLIIATPGGEIAEFPPR